MAFKPKMISDEESAEINDNFQLSITDSIAESQQQVDDKLPKKSTTTKVERKRKTTKKKPAVFNPEEAALNAGVDNDKWKEFKRIALKREVYGFADDKSRASILLPGDIVEKLREVSKFSSSIYVTAIVSNLVTEFLEKNADILDILEKKFSEFRK